MFTERRRFQIEDVYSVLSDPPAEPTVFDGELDPDQSTGPLEFTVDDIGDNPDMMMHPTMATFQRLPDGEKTEVTVYDGEEISML